MIVDLPLPPFRLACGAALPGLHVRVQALGPGVEPLAPWEVAAPPTATVVRRTAGESAALWASAPPPRLPPAPTVVLVHALTGEARAGGPGGWWAPLVGPGRVFDTDRVRVLCANLLGSCYGTFGAADAEFPRWRDVPGPDAPDGPGALPPPPEWAPAPVTTWDQARMLLALLDALGIDTVDRVAGGSVGGMVALAVQALAPDRVRAVDAVATDAVATPWVIGWNQVGRQAVFADPSRGLELARQLAHLSYRADEGLSERQGRRRTGPGWRASYAMQTYLEHQGHKLAARFDPASYVAMLDTMDHHDLARMVQPDPHESWRADGPWGEARLHDVRGVGLTTDRLFPPERLRDLCARVPGGAFHLIANPHGHDAFLLAWEELAAALGGPGSPA